MMLLQIYMIESDFWKKGSRLTLAHVHGEARGQETYIRMSALESSVIAQHWNSPPFPSTNGRAD